MSATDDERVDVNVKMSESGRGTTTMSPDCEICGKPLDSKPCSMIHAFRRLRMQFRRLGRQIRKSLPHWLGGT